MEQLNERSDNLRLCHIWIGSINKAVVSCSTKTRLFFPPLGLNEGRDLDFPTDFNYSSKPFTQPVYIECYILGNS